MESARLAPFLRLAAWPVLVLAAVLLFAWAMHLRTVRTFETQGLRATGRVRSLRTVDGSDSHGESRRFRFVHLAIALPDGRTGFGAASEHLPPGIFGGLGEGSPIAVRYLPGSVFPDGLGGFNVQEVLLEASIPYVKFRSPALLSGAALGLVGLLLWGVGGRAGHALPGPPAGEASRRRGR